MLFLTFYTTNLEITSKLPYFQILFTINVISFIKTAEYLSKYVIKKMKDFFLLGGKFFYRLNETYRKVETILQKSYACKYIDNSQRYHYLVLRMHEI